MPAKRRTARLNLDLPSPYLRDNMKLLESLFNTPPVVVDLGSGNERNRKLFDKWWAAAPGLYKPEYIGFDIKPEPNSFYLDLNDGRLPLPSHSVHIVLMNYVLMFLDRTAILKILLEVERVLRSGGVMVIELYPAENSGHTTQADLNRILSIVMTRTDTCRIIKKTKNRLILRYIS